MENYAAKQTWVSFASGLKTKDHDKERKQRKLNQRNKTASNIDISYDANMQHFPINNNKPVKETDGFNNIILCPFTKIYVF